MINTHKKAGNILAFLKFSRPQIDKNNYTQICCLEKQVFHTLSVTYNITQNVNHVLCVCVCRVCVCVECGVCVCVCGENQYGLSTRVSDTHVRAPPLATVRL